MCKARNERYDDKNPDDDSGPSLLGYDVDRRRNSKRGKKRQQDHYGGDGFWNSFVRVFFPRNVTSHVQ